MTLHASPFPWLLVAAGLPALSGAAGILWPARRSLCAAIGLGALWLVMLVLVWMYVPDLKGAQLVTVLPGLTVGMDGWGLLGMVVSAAMGTIAALHAWRTSHVLPPLLLATGAALLAHAATDIGVVLVAAVAGITVLGGLGVVELVLVGIGLSGMLAGADSLLAFPLLLAGLGGLAACGGASTVAGQLVRAGALTPALLLVVPRVLFAAYGDSAMIWTQATAPAMGLLALWGGLRSLGGRTLGAVSRGLVMLQAGVVLTGWHFVRLDAWSGAVLGALWVGPLVGLLLLSGTDGLRWARQRGQPRHGAVAFLAGMTTSGLPGTPGFVILLMLTMGAWQSQWRHAPWWLLLIGVAVWLGAFAPVRLGLALRRGSDEGVPLPRTVVLLVGATLLIGILPRIMMDTIDHASVARLEVMGPSLEKLVSGELRSLLPPQLQGWWL